MHFAAFLSTAQGVPGEFREDSEGRLHYDPSFRDHQTQKHGQTDRPSPLHRRYLLAGTECRLLCLVCLFLQPGNSFLLKIPSFGQERKQLCCRHRCFVNFVVSFLVTKVQSFACLSFLSVVSQLRRCSIAGVGRDQAERGRHNVCQSHLHQDSVPGAVRVHGPGHPLRTHQRPVRLL